jgi:hypothetical protein
VIGAALSRLPKAKSSVLALQLTVILHPDHCANASESTSERLREWSASLPASSQLKAAVSSLARTLEARPSECGLAFAAWQKVKKVLRAA